MAQPGPQPQSFANFWVLSIYTIQHFLELTQSHLQHEISEFSEASQQSHCTVTELVSAREQPQPALGAKGGALLSVPVTAHSSLAVLSCLGPCVLWFLILGEGREKTDFSMCHFAYKLNFERPECAKWAGRVRDNKCTGRRQ